jgi:hypothetical protein
MKEQIINKNISNILLYKLYKLFSFWENFPLISIKCYYIVMNSITVLLFIFIIAILLYYYQYGGLKSTFATSASNSLKYVDLEW